MKRSLFPDAIEHNAGRFVTVETPAQQRLRAETAAKRLRG